MKRRSLLLAVPALLFPRPCLGQMTPGISNPFLMAHSTTCVYTTFDQATAFGTVTFSNGNLTILSNGAGAVAAKGINYKSSGKFYVEFTMDTCVNGNTCCGIIKSTQAMNNFPVAVTNGFAVFRSGNVWFNGAATGKNIGSFTSGQLIPMAIDFDNLTGWFRKGTSGNWNGDASADPATNTGGVSISGITPDGPIGYLGGNSEKITADFGASAFSGTVPSGFTSGWPC